LNPALVAAIFAWLSIRLDHARLGTSRSTAHLLVRGLLSCLALTAAADIGVNKLKSLVVNLQAVGVVPASTFWHIALYHDPVFEVAVIADAICLRTGPGSLGCFIVCLFISRMYGT
jgi:hypothetical protein